MKKVLITGLAALALLAGVGYAADVEAVNTRQGYTTLYEVRDSVTALAEGGTLTNGVTVEGGATVSDGGLTVTAGGLTVTAGGLTVTAGGLTVGGSVTYDTVTVTDTNAYTVLAANSGKAHFVPDLTADSTFTLPDAADGLNYKFVYMGSAADAHDWLIDTGADANYYIGGVIQHDVGDASITAYYSDADSNSKLTVYTAAAGTSVELWCDGTNWRLTGTILSDTATGAALADQ